MTVLYVLGGSPCCQFPFVFHVPLFAPIHSLNSTMAILTTFGVLALSTIMDAVKPDGTVPMVANCS